MNACKNRKLMLGIGAVLFVAVNLQAGVIIDDATFSTGGPNGWFSSKIANRTGGDFLDITLDDPTFASVYRGGTAGTLGVSETLTVSFDIARSAGVTGGDVRAYIVDTTNTRQGYSFSASLGLEGSTKLYHTESGINVNSGATPADVYTTTGTPAAIVGTNIVSNFDTYKMTIFRNDADTLTFDVSQNGGAALISETYDFDGVDKPVSELMTNFNRLYIGWGNTGATTSDSLYLDNVSVTVIPEPGVLGLMGVAGLGLLVLRRFRM